MSVQRWIVRYMTYTVTVAGAGKPINDAYRIVRKAEGWSALDDVIINAHRHVEVILQRRCEVVDPIRERWIGVRQPLDIKRYRARERRAFYDIHRKLAYGIIRAKGDGARKLVGDKLSLADRSGIGEGPNDSKDS